MMIGEFARRAGVKVETVRYYERRGLLPRPERTSAGYRLYQAEAVAELRFIKRAQTLGFTLQEVKELLALRVQPDSACDVVDRKAHEKLSVVRGKIGELTALEQRLTVLANACDGTGAIRQCPILHELEA